MQVKGGVVMRVLPLENEEVNECWLSDRDRFSYEGLNVEERLTQPDDQAGRQAGRKPTGRPRSNMSRTACATSATSMARDAIAALATPGSTLEELSLLKKLVAALDRTISTSACASPTSRCRATVAPWLGMSIAEFGELERVFVIGSFLRKDHPLLAARLRAAVKNGAKLGILHASDDDLLMPVAAKMIAAPSAWLSALGEIMAAVSVAKAVALPAGFENVEASPRMRN